jgi:hypothetical protein
MTELAILVSFHEHPAVQEPGSRSAVRFWDQGSAGLRAPHDPASALLVSRAV